MFSRQGGWSLFYFHRNFCFFLRLFSFTFFCIFLSFNLPIWSSLLQWMANNYDNALASEKMVQLGGGWDEFMFPVLSCKVMIFKYLRHLVFEWLLKSLLRIRCFIWRLIFSFLLFTQCYNNLAVLKQKTFKPVHKNMVIKIFH